MNIEEKDKRAIKRFIFSETIVQIILLLFSVIAIVWYWYTSQGVVNFGKNIAVTAAIISIQLAILKESFSNGMSQKKNRRAIRQNRKIY
jgi:membrane protein YdbS with pleckstrin-like domain